MTEHEYVNVRNLHVLEKASIDIGKLRLYNNGTIFIEANGIPDEFIASKIGAKIIEFSEIYNGKINLIINLNKVGKPSSNARKKFKEIVNNDIVNKVALHGLNPVARTIGYFLINISFNSKIKLIESFDEASVWFNE